EAGDQRATNVTEHEKNSLWVKVVVVQVAGSPVSGFPAANSLSPSPGKTDRPPSSPNLFFFFLARDGNHLLLLHQLIDYHGQWVTALDVGRTLFSGRTSMRLRFPERADRERLLDPQQDPLFAFQQKEFP